MRRSTLGIVGWHRSSRSIRAWALRVPRSDPRRLRPGLLELEGRQLLSTFTVNNPTDSAVAGETDLRQAIAPREFRHDCEHDRLQCLDICLPSDHHPRRQRARVEQQNRVGDDHGSGARSDHQRRRVERGLRN